MIPEAAKAAGKEIAAASADSGFRPEQRLEQSRLSGRSEARDFDPDRRLDRRACAEQPASGFDPDKRLGTDLHCPTENGSWEGVRGDSVWRPDPDYVPQKSNPEGLSWREILSDHQLRDGIRFEKGNPDFSSVSVGDVRIGGFTANRSENFRKADSEFARSFGYDAKEVQKWRQDNGYTWHECRDMKHMQLVPSLIHNNISHSGGYSAAKQMGI